MNNQDREKSGGDEPIDTPPLRCTNGLVAAIADRPNPDGSHDVTIDHNGERIAVNIHPQHVQELIAKFQARIFRMGEQMQIPQLAVNRIEVARKESICDLMVSTVQAGTMVLAMSDADLRHMKKEIDRVLAYRRGSTEKN